MEAFIANSSFVPVQVETTPLDDPRWKWIDIGPFKDRLGADALAIAASSHDACKASVETLNGRQYIDLGCKSLTDLLSILIATEQPTANPIFPGSGPMTEEKVKLILETPTTEEERHIKGL